MELAPLVRDLAVILFVAGLVSLLFQKIKQPVVLGYIIAGMIVGPYTPPYPLVTDIPSIRTWAELGVIFLMFSLGLEFSFRKLASVGLSAGITAGFEVMIMVILGFVTGHALGWSSMDSLFLGAMLSISSTTIIIRALDELRLKTRRFSEMIFAVLIVEDLVAILLLVALSTFVTQRGISGTAMLASAGKLILFIGGWFLSGYFVIPRFVRYVGRVGSNEVLTLISLGLCLMLVVFAAHFHYSAALGAFIMGSILAESTESQRIEERLESLRDLFAAIFFVSIGMLMDPVMIFRHMGSILIITVVTVVGKVLSTTLGALLTGQSLRTSIQVGFGLTQIGEFSFIIAGLGQTLGVTSDFLYPIAVAVSLITTFLTPYMIRMSHRFAVALEDRLPHRMSAALTQYSNWAQVRHTDSTQKKEFTQFFMKWALNGIIVSVLFVSSFRYLPDWVDERIHTGTWSGCIAWFLTVVLSSPFGWGMWSAFRQIPLAPLPNDETIVKNMGRIGLTLFFRFATVVWLAALSLAFFPVRYVLIVGSVLLVGLFVFFYKQLEIFYAWFESRFLATFEVSAKTPAPKDVLRQLAPWDAHLIRLKVHPNSEAVTQKLSDAQLRTRLGLNIVVIQRGLKTIVAPKPHEVILPGDELLVLSTDEQLEASRAYLERPKRFLRQIRPISDYTLKQARVNSNSPLVGTTIRASGVREGFGSMVVGLERGDERIINPESDMMLKPGDRLWIVGAREKLDQLLVSLFPPEEQKPSEALDSF